MWRKEDGRAQGSSEISTSAAGSTMGTASGKNLQTPAAISHKAAACVSQGIKIKGEISGNEELFVDGHVEGTITCASSTVTLGPNATIKADVTARELIVRGRVEGQLIGTERIQVWRSARVQGDLKAERISIEEGAELHGMLEAGKPPVRVSERAGREGAKKTDASMLKAAGKAEDKPASDAAIAGAD